MLDGFVDRRRLYHLRGGRINGLSKHSRLRLRRIQRLDDPVHGQVRQDDDK